MVSLHRELEWAIYLQSPVEVPQPLGSGRSVCEDHSHSWHSLTILSPKTDLLQCLLVIPEIESGLASSPTEWTSGGGLWSVRHFRRFSLTAGYCRQSLMPMFSLMVKELENFPFLCSETIRGRTYPEGCLFARSFYTTFFHHIIFQQTVEKLIWYLKAKPKLASGSWLFTSIASLLHINWKDVVSTPKYCCRLFRSYYFMTCESVLQENYYFCNTTLSLCALAEDLQNSIKTYTQYPVSIFCQSNMSWWVFGGTSRSWWD